MTSELSSFAARLRDLIAPDDGPREEAHGENSKRETRNSNLGETEFNTLALRLFALQLDCNAAYRRLCEARGVKPAALQHWSQIPAVPTTAFKELELTCLAPAERTAVFHSSGTTAQRPSRHFHSAESLALYEDSLWSWFRQHIFAQTAIGEQQLAILTPRASAAPNSSLVHMFETIRQKVGASESAFLGGTDSAGAWTLDFSRAENLFRSVIAANQPLVLLGTAFNFVHLLDWLTDRDLRFELPPGSVVMETGGYKGRSRELPKAELHALISRRLCVEPAQIICEYGMSELSSQAYDSKPRNTQHATRCFHFPSWARAQIISPETGREVADSETGLLRIFDLANAFSVLAVQTEDLARRCGDGFELLGRAVAAEPRGCSLMAT